MSFLDLILIAFLLYMFFSGYSKGFFSTLYDLVSFMIMMLFIYFNVETISSIIQIYKPVNDPLSQLGGSVINMLIVFIIMFVVLEVIRRRKFDSCLQFFTNQIAQNVDYINAFEFFYCQIRENKCTNMG